MLQRLRDREVPDATLHGRACAELARRLATWWGSSLPPARRFGSNAPETLDLPIVLAPDPIEPLIVHAISAVEPAAFGVTADGAVYTTDHENGYRVFVSGLSALLDEVAVIFLQIAGGTNHQFIELDECFFADYASVGDCRPFVVVGSERVAAIAQRALSELQHPSTGFESAFTLHVDVKAGDWRSKGVLAVMGYHVGKSSELTLTERRQVLRKVVDMVLVAQTPESEEYVRKWGGPQSEKRIAKIALSIAESAYLAAGRRNADMSDPLSDWKCDLEWLKQTYGRRSPQRGTQRWPRRRPGFRGK